LVWRVDTASREINRPAGVSFALQIKADSVEPTVPSRSRNLLSHDDSGPSGTDEAMKVRPQMPWIIGSEPFAGRRERLARTGAGPEWSVVRPSSKSSCDGPEAPAGEEMALGVAVEVIGHHFLDGAGVDIARRQNTVIDERAEDMRSGMVEFVVVGAGHG
jgi:hypothetical protein